MSFDFTSFWTFVGLIPFPSDPPSVWFVLLSLRRTYSISFWSSVDLILCHFVYPSMWRDIVLILSRSDSMAFCPYIPQILYIPLLIIYPFGVLLTVNQSDSMSFWSYNSLSLCSFDPPSVWFYVLLIVCPADFKSSRFSVSLVYCPDFFVRLIFCPDYVHPPFYLSA